MIEENVAIICACLPMCRLPLALVFPTVFGNRDTQKSSNYKYGSSQRSQASGPTWQPYAGPHKEGIQSSAHHHTGDDTSEEFILTSVKRHSVPDLNDSSREGTDPNGIRKTTQYEVTYETDAMDRV